MATSIPSALDSSPEYMAHEDMMYWPVSKLGGGGWNALSQPRSYIHQCIFQFFFQFFGI